MPSPTWQAREECTKQRHPITNIAQTRDKFAEDECRIQREPVDSAWRLCTEQPARRAVSHRVVPPASDERIINATPTGLTHYRETPAGYVAVKGEVPTRHRGFCLNAGQQCPRRGL
jgi:hypothetical protein